MRGWLVTNAFLKTAKFNELYSYLQHSAETLGIELVNYTSASLVGDVSSDFSEFGTRPDFVLFWDKDVCLARRLERAGLRLFNNAFAVETCDSKAQTALALSGVVPTPATMLSPKTFQGVGYTDLAFVETAAKKLGLPFVIKEEFGSFGQQVYLAKTVDEAKKIVSKFDGKSFVMQQFIAESYGRDIRINVVGGKVVCAMLRRSNNDFRSNVTLGGTAQPYTPTPAEIEIALAATKAVGADFAGVDVLFGNGGPLLCEVNSNPHFKSTLDCTGVDLSKHILQHIVNSMKK